mgnify:CR=1 FL=1
MKYFAYIFLLIISIAFFIIIIYTPSSKTAQSIKYGVTFSPTYTQSLGLDWKKTYLDILTDLKVRYLRLPTYWKEIEPEPNKYFFDDVDFMISEAQKQGAKIIMVVGIKQPRWPECQPPNWAYDLSLKDRQQKTLQMIKQVVRRYASSSAVVSWQVENEPLFAFGVRCDPPDRDFLRKEGALVKSLDNRPVVITDSGEFRPWVTPMSASDIFGTTLYREAKHNLFGYIKYPITSGFYSFKSNVIRSFFAPKNKKTIIAELQTEPWSDRSLKETPTDEQTKLFSAKHFKENVEFAKLTGFDEIYLWGVEWWYFMATQNHPEYLQYAKGLFETGK